jgi:DNA repair protein RadC
VRSRIIALASLSNSSVVASSSSIMMMWAERHPTTNNRYEVRWLQRARRLLHNHASGYPTPLHADIQMTNAIIDIAGPLGTAVHDHIIVGRNGHASLKALKLI